MFEDFDDFAQEHDQKKSDRELIAKEAANQWANLLSLVPKLADGNRGFNGQTFSWVLDAGVLCLGDVAARFERVSVHNSPERGHYVTFGRAPAFPGKMYLEDSPIRAETWNLELQLTNGEFTWSASGFGGTVPAEVLVNIIARHLSACYLEYEKAYGR